MFYGWWIVIIVFLASAFGGATIWYGFTAFFKPLINEFGWSYTAISLVASFRGLEVGAMDVFVGFLVDRFGGRRIVFVSSILIGIGFLMLSRINSLATFYLSYAVIFIGTTGIGNVVFFQLITRWFRKRLGLALGLSGAGVGAGGFAIPGIVYLLDILGFRTVFVIFGITALVLGGLMGYFIRSRPEDIGCSPDGVPLPQHEQTSGYSNAPARRSIDGIKDCTFVEAISDPAFWIITYVSAVTAFTTLMVTTHVMPYLEHIGHSRYTAGMVAMMIPVTSIIGRLGVGWISDFVSNKVIFVLALVAATIGIALFLHARLSFLLIPFVILFGISYGGIMILRPAILKRRYGSTYIGSLIGFCLGLAIFGSIFGPLLGGWIFDTTGNYDLAWIISGILLIIGIPLMLIMKNRPGIQ
ncbi:MFS transporter [Chloroflexota bacterium]